MMASERLYALTIYGYRKPGMPEDEYHHYLSDHHAVLVRNHLVKMGIVRYTLVGWLRNYEWEKLLTLLDAQHVRDKRDDEAYIWKPSRGPYL